ncbi:trans-sulfuration enzyme family protein [Pseudobacteriovorax antillogorgiicola]|uniref:Cystathionine gamma-synthase n=1 Tax=Pseudobacteriovorax antillogorgiicola TaxID=1513793 RepID=A0A1Y6BZ17_9BACT|nr:PLP-dependent transferase [Pseudobacteriovorax antillogorgiicola]TCS53143.1 cystathionine gamma-synthase [Pseudobacteriovorax antillogorgiicola]SMF25255.1 cystathionine gamma-synthase [Pseudobacteriovorax antillogorgiicola]
MNEIKSEPLSLSTQAAQALGWVEPGFGGIVPPIYMASSYERDETGRYPGNHSYTRDQNPSFDQAEALLASMEGGSACMLFASGMAAATSIFEVLAPSAHVVIPKKMYFAIRMWLQRLAAKGRIRLSQVDHHDLEGLTQLMEIDPFDLMWIETPANPSSEIIDIRAWTEVAHQGGAKVVADNTLATPVLTRPLDYGVDLVMHSASKQLNGHGDVVAGALVTAKQDKFWEDLQFERGYRGAIVSPTASWLLLRGMRTLHLRVPASAASALRIANFLEAQSMVESVLYPGLESHPEHYLAKQQMQEGFGYVVTFALRGGEKEARHFISNLKLFKNASSLGSVESQAELRALTEGEASIIKSNLIRLSVGIESCDDLIHDLERAFFSSSDRCHGSK